MSKSYGNGIPLFAPEKELRKLVMSIKTDSTPLEAPKSIKGTLISELYSLFSTPERLGDLEARLNKGGVGWGHAKEELFLVMNEELKGLRSRYLALRADEENLNRILEKGAARAFELGSATLNRVRQAVGFAKYPYKFSR